MPTVLVVDDKPSQTQLLSIMLTQLGVECITAHSGTEGIQSAKNYQPDLVLMDWIMPSDTLNGADATRALLSDPDTRHIPIIACTAVADSNEAMQAGCTDFLRKPFDMNMLRQKIQRYI